jgi:hypothetical protein
MLIPWLLLKENAVLHAKTGIFGSEILANLTSIIIKVLLPFQKKKQNRIIIHGAEEINMACYLCKEWELGKITEQEAYRALGELLEFETDQEARDHLFGLSEKILDNSEASPNLDVDTEYLLDLEDEDDCL